MKITMLLPMTLILATGNMLWADNSAALQQQTPTPHLSAPPSNLQLQSQAIHKMMLPDGRYRVEVAYQTTANQVEDSGKFVFEGSLEEIREQLQRSELPQARKQAVLPSLNANPAELLNHLWGAGFPVPHAPGTGQDPFAQPFFQQGLKQPFAGQNPFDHPFFKQPPFAEAFMQPFLQGMPDAKNRIDPLSPEGNERNERNVLPPQDSQSGMQPMMPGRGSQLF